MNAPAPALEGSRLCFKANLEADQVSVVQRETEEEATPRLEEASQLRRGLTKAKEPLVEVGDPADDSGTQWPLDGAVLEGADTPRASNLGDWGLLVAHGVPRGFSRTIPAEVGLG